jgi:hypothetical protein
MNNFSNFEDCKLSNTQQSKVKAGIDVNVKAICDGLYAVVGMSLDTGDQAAASAAWQAWLNMGCQYL